MADAGRKAKRKSKRKGYDSTATKKRLGARDARKLARRLANGLDYLTDEEQDELARQAADSFLNDPDGPFQEIEDESKRRYLRAMSVTGVRAQSARLAGVSRDIIYTDQWQGDEQFQTALKRAELAGSDSLIGEAYRRGVEGVEKPTGWYMGNPGGVVREYSDQLLVKLMHASAHGDLFRDRMDVRSVSVNLDAEMLDRLPPPVLAAISHGTPLAIALTEYVARLLERGEAAQLPEGRDVTPSGANDGG